jgi:hypothetical protein
MAIKHIIVLFVETPRKFITVVINLRGVSTNKTIILLQLVDKLAVPEHVLLTRCDILTRVHGRISRTRKWRSLRGRSLHRLVVLGSKIPSLAVKTDSKVASSFLCLFCRVSVHFVRSLHFPKT